MSEDEAVEEAEEEQPAQARHSGRSELAARTDPHTRLVLHARPTETPTGQQQQQEKETGHMGQAKD